MKQKIEAVLFFAGIVIMLGAFGGADRGTLDIIHAAMWSLGGLGLMAVSYGMEALK